ncbi:MAG: hypothetical protein K9N06_03095 [Candidatus Cloacimonetes bacterium]|nr:hypothetical protein [Candidatus Cloacimonadota bacterium]
MKKNVDENKSKPMLLTDLLDDQSFFEDLKNEKYCLVLGAGFSFGIKNRFNSECPQENTIPIVSDFIELTKKYLSNADNKDEVRDFNSAANAWHKYIEDEAISESEKEERFNEFKKMFLVDEGDFEKVISLYQNILIPNWSRIYTFNIDNVLDVLIKENPGDYEVQYNEAGTFSSEYKIGIGYLHNSILNAKTFNDIVFTNNQYGKKIQGKDNHLYYSLFNDIKTHKKDLLIIGCQFNEQTVYTFILNEDRGLRNDLRIININYNKPDYGYEIEKNIKDRKWIQCSAVEFLQFLSDNREKIEAVPYPGAEIISKDFKERVSINSSFTEANFYTSKLDYNCQWYGIIMGWDIERGHYKTIKNRVIESFSSPRIMRLSAVVHGSGGSGKSTLLRRLAIDCIMEEFTVLWVNDLEQFSELSTRKILNNPQKMYLIIIEDWYRISRHNAGFNTLLKSLMELENIRIVIGDRIIKAKKYLDYLYDPDHNTFELTSGENKDIISKITEKIPSWKEAADLVLNKPGSENVTLYLLLFLIARIAESLEVESILDFNDLIAHFREIVKSDVKKIAEIYPGIAKALFYWASVNKNDKIIIDMNSFLNLAESFQKDDNIKYFNLETGDSIARKYLNIYITLTDGAFLNQRYAGLKLIVFNHDLLPEEGLSQAILEGWQEYDSDIKRKMLDIIVDKGEDITASCLLRSYFDIESNIFKNDEQKLEYIHTLLNKNNTHSTYLYYLFSQDFYPEIKKKKEFSIELLNKNHDNELQFTLICLSLQLLKGSDEGKDFAREFLEKNRYHEVRFQIICNCLEILKDSNEGKEYAKELLEKNKEEIVNNDIICTCLRILKGSSEGIEYARELLERSKKKVVNHAVLCNSLEILKGTIAGKGFAKEFLEKSKKEVVNHAVLCNSLEILKDLDEGKEYAKELLGKNRISEVRIEIICNCLEILKDTIEGKEYAKELLGKNKIREIRYEIICHCLEILKDTIEGKEYAKKLLEKDKTEAIRFEMICICLDILRETNEGKNYAKELLEKNREKALAHPIICNCLNILRETNEGKNCAEELLEKNRKKALTHQIICSCLDILRKTSIGKSFAEELLEKNKTEAVNIQIICVCLDILRETNIGKTFAEELLKKNRKKTLTHQIICSCLDILRETSIGKTFAEELLIKNKVKTVNNQIICVSLAILKETVSGKTFALELLDNQNWRQVDWNIVWRALDCIAFHKLSNRIISDIIRDWKSGHNRGEGVNRRFYNILRIPFQHQKEWAEFAKNLIKNWMMYNRLIISNIIISYKSMSSEILPVCKDILNRWEGEIKYQVKKKYCIFDNHISLSLAHPELKDLAREKSQEIIEYDTVNPGILTLPLIDTAKKIIEEEQFPEW